MGTQSNQSNTSIKVSFEKSLNTTSLPLLQTQKEGYNLYFLLDTGANKNYIRQDFINLAELNADTITLDEVEEFYEIDNVCHQTKTCNFRFNLGEHEYMEKYQVIPDGSALTFPTTDGNSFHVAGILGTPFMMKYKAQMNFRTSEILISLPEGQREPEYDLDSLMADYQV